MSVANIQPAQAALFTKARTGQIFTRGQMAYVQGFTRMAKDFMPPPYDDNSFTVKILVLKNTNIGMSQYRFTKCVVWIY